MEKYFVIFNSFDDIKHFVALMEKCDVTVDLMSGSIVVDAKSLQGVAAIGIGRKLEVLVNGTLPESIAEALYMYK